MRARHGNAADAPETGELAQAVKDNMGSERVCNEARMRTGMGGSTV